MSESIRGAWEQPGCLGAAKVRQSLLGHALLSLHRHGAEARRDSIGSQPGLMDAAW